MKRSRCRSLVAGLALGATLAGGLAVPPAAADTIPALPAGVVPMVGVAGVVPVVGVAGIAMPPIVVTTPAIGVGTQHAHVEKDRDHSREHANVIRD